MVLSDELSEPIFAVTVGSGWIHVYPTAGGLLAIRDMDSGPPDAVEFFDIRSRRLAPVFDRSWRMIGLRPTGAPMGEAAVRSLLSNVVERLRQSVDDRLAKSGSTTVTREQALARLPDLGERSLAECYALLRTDFGDGPDVTDDGSFWHNFFCHCC